MSTRILVVDDDIALAEMIGIMLKSEGFEPFYCHDGAEVLGMFEQVDPDVVLLDLMLPGIDGIEICRQITASHDTPVIILTARTDTQDVVAGLEAGADDYVIKPFKSQELIARVRARIRRRPVSEGHELVNVADVMIDVAAHEVRRGDTIIPVTPLEFDLLLTLARDPWKAFSRHELLEKVWGYRHEADTRLVNVHVQRLRSKIERDPERPQVVVTVRGVGYRAGTAE